MFPSYQDLAKKLDSLIERNDINFFIVFKFNFAKNKLQELYRKDPQNFFGGEDNKEAENFARIVVRVKKIVQQMLSNQDFDKQKIITLSTILTNNLNLHVIAIQTQIFFVASTMNFFSFVSKLSGETRGDTPVPNETVQQKEDSAQLLNIEKMILQRVEKLEKLTTTMIEVAKQLKEVLEKK